MRAGDHSREHVGVGVTRVGEPQLEVDGFARIGPAVPVALVDIVDREISRTDHRRLHDETERASPRPLVGRDVPVESHEMLVGRVPGDQKLVRLDAGSEPAGRDIRERSRRRDDGDVGIFASE